MELTRVVKEVTLDRILDSTLSETVRTRKLGFTCRFGVGEASAEKGLRGKPTSPLIFPERRAAQSALARDSRRGQNVGLRGAGTFLVRGAGGFPVRTFPFRILLETPVGCP